MFIRSGICRKEGIGDEKFVAVFDMLVVDLAAD